MTKHMPPGLIMMLLEIHCFVYTDQLSMLNDSPASENFVSRLLIDELISIDPQVQQPDEDRERHPFSTTARGQALINKWGSTPLPVLEEKWV